MGQINIHLIQRFHETAIEYHANALNVKHPSTLLQYTHTHTPSKAVKLELVTDIQMQT